MNRFFLTAIVSATGALLVGQSGCGPAKTATTTKKDAQAKADPWVTLTAAVRDEADAQACRQMLAELNNGLAANPAAERPLVVAATELQPVTQALRLPDKEVKYLTSAEYTPLDAQYLAECLYLRDAAASLGLDPADPTAVRATAAFNWVCRQIILNPWLTQTQQGQQANPPLPPAFVLRRGSGSSLERAYTFVALCRQLDLDACLVGTAAADQSWSYTRESELKGYPEGPFWAVGVRDGDDIRLFDPVRGEPFPGKGTLADLRANPAVLDPWKKAAESKWTIPDDQVKAAELSVSVPLSAVAPRFISLDQRVRAETNARLAVDLKALLERLTKASGGAAVKGWNPPSDAYSPVRGLDTFLPADQGGGTFGYATVELYPPYQGSLLRLGKAIVFPPELTNVDVRTKLADAAVGVYATAFQPQLAPQEQVVWSPREKIQRGRHIEVTKDMVFQRDRFRTAESQRAGAVNVGLNAAVAKWSELANTLYDELSRAKVADDRAIRLPIITKRLEEFWLGTRTEQGVLLTDILAKAGIGEATYLLALSFHERAERAQLEADRAARTQPADPAAVQAARKQAGIDWKSALDWWGRYEEYRKGQDDSDPGRAAHAKKMFYRASQLAAK